MSLGRSELFASKLSIHYIHGLNGVVHKQAPKAGGCARGYRGDWAEQKLKALKNDPGKRFSVPGNKLSDPENRFSIHVSDPMKQISETHLTRTII